MKTPILWSIVETLPTTNVDNAQANLKAKPKIQNFYKEAILQLYSFSSKNMTWIGTWSQKSGLNMTDKSENDTNGGSFNKERALVGKVPSHSIFLTSYPEQKSKIS